MKILVLGIGNEFRSDDGAGLCVARALRDLAIEGVTVLEHSGEGASLMEAWRGVDSVIAADAMVSEAPPGTVTRFDATNHPLPAIAFPNSTHAFSLPQAIELARTLNQLPGRFIVYGIEATDFSAGTQVSVAVGRGVCEAARRILEELQAQLGRTIPLLHREIPRPTL